MPNTAPSLFRNLALVAVLIAMRHVYAQGYQYTIGGDTSVFGYQHIIRSSDNNSLYVSGRAGPGFEACEIQVARINTDLDTLWTYRYHAEDLDFAGSLCELSNGDIIAVGTTTVNDDQHGLMIRLSPTGDTLWTKVFMEAPYGGFEHVELGSGDTLIVSGYLGTNTTFIQQYNATGDPLWPEPIHLNGYAVEHHFDHSGDTLYDLSNYWNTEDILLTMRTFSTGEVLGSWMYDFQGQTSPVDMVIEHGRIVILANRTDGGQPWKNLLLSVSHDGTLLESRTYCAPDPQLTGGRLLPYSSGYLLLGHSEYINNAPSANLPNIGVMSISANLDSLDTQYFGTDLLERMADVTVCNGLIYGCGIFYPSPSPRDLLLFRIDTVNYFVGVNPAEASDRMLIYPNPTSGDAYLDVRPEEWMQCDVLDMEGKLVLSTHPSNGGFHLQSDIFRPGVYVVRLMSRGTQALHSMLLVKAPDLLE